MKRVNSIQNNLFYKHRYIIVTILLVALSLFSLVYRFWDIPYGLTEAEITSATTSQNISLSDTGSLINLPWSLLQLLTIKLLGLNTIGIRLPAVILGLLTVGLTILLIKRLTKANLAVMSGLLLISSSFVMSLSRSGTPAIMSVLLLVLALLASERALNTNRSTRRWNTILLAIAVGLLCYMENGIYILLALAIVAMLHPRTRLELTSDKKRTLGYIGGILVVISPLIAIVIYGATSGDYSLLRRLFAIGAPSLSNFASFASSVAGLASTLLNGQVVPILTIVGGAMASIGLIVMLRYDSSSVRAYALIGLIIALCVLGVFNPSSCIFVIIPAIILEAICLGSITGTWYGLFPSNPYARTFAILPLAILISSLSSVDMGRYFNSVSYVSDVAYGYDLELATVNQLIDDNDEISYELVVAPSQTNFYKGLANGQLTVHSSDEWKSSDWEQALSDKHQVIVLSSTDVSISENAKLSQAYCDWHKDNNYMLSVYSAK